MRSDSLFYELFAASPAVFFELIGQPCPAALQYGFVSQEVKESSFRIDGVFLPPESTPELTLYFVEVMGYRDREDKLYRKFFAEIFVYLNDYAPVNDWQAILIFIKRSLDPGVPKHYDGFETIGRLQRVYLEDITNQIEDRSLELDLLCLIGIKQEEVIQEARRLIEETQATRSPDTGRDRLLELIQVICVYKFPNLKREEVERMLGISELRQTRVYQDAMQEGVEQGLAQGLEQGRVEMLQRLLTKKLGSLQASVERDLHQLSQEQLDSLAESFLDFRSQDDLLNWLSAAVS